MERTDGDGGTLVQTGSVRGVQWWAGLTFVRTALSMIISLTLKFRLVSYASCDSLLKERCTDG